MTSLFVLSAFLYLGWVLLYLLRKRIRKVLFPKTKLPPAITPIEHNDDDDNEIMGKTKTQLSQVVTNDDTLCQKEKPIENATTFAASNENTRSPVVDNSELDSVFSDSPEPMDLDIESEYDEEELLDQEVINCFVDDETTEPATGIPYDEMENLIQVMQQSGSSQATELTAVNTIQQMEQTELFQLMVSQIAGSKERITEMLNKYKLDSSGTKPMIAENGNADFEKFEINIFL